MERFLIREGASDKQNQNENKEDKKIVKSTGNKRKYVEDYLKYGFIPSVNDPSLPFCLICQKTLSNETMVPSKLLRHIETNHWEQMNNPISYFENIQSSFQKQSKKFKKFMTTSDEAQTASYMIAQLIARKKKAHAEAEETILPALKIVAGCMLTNDAMEKVTKIPLSSKTIAKRIEDISEDIELQIKQSFNDSSTKWAIQLDETTDISNKAQLLAFLRFVDTGKIVNNYFFCKELKLRTTGADIFELVDENVMKYNLRWENCVSVCTDGAPAMKGSRKGLIAHVIKKNPNIKFVHCMIHREMLVSKSVPPILVTTLDEVVKVVNYIKSNALRSRIFSTFCEAMDSDYKNLLFHTEVRWLSKGKVLNRFISMENEIMAFIDNEEINFPFMMSDVWWLRVSFLGDIFDKLNSLNLNLQGAQENIITISTKLKAFKEKLSLWNLNIAKENFASFPMVQENPSKSIIKKEVEETLTLLSASFDKYFPYLDVEKMEWVVNPFMHCEIQHLEEEMQENLIDLKNDLVFKRLFTEKELSEFWLCLNSKFPKLSNAAIESLLPFGSSNLCEQGFSTLTEMKSKKRERLQMIDEEMRCLFDNHHDWVKQNAFVIKTGSTTQWQADLAPKEMAASDMRNRHRVQPLLTMEYKRCSSCIPGALTGYYQPGQLSPGSIKIGAIRLSTTSKPQVSGMVTTMADHCLPHASQISEGHKKWLHFIWSVTSSSFLSPLNHIRPLVTELPLVSPASCELRSVIQFLAAKKNSADIHTELCQVYGEGCMSSGMVRRWVREFKNSRTDVHDEPRAGRPSVSDETIAKVEAAMLEDRRVTVRKLCDLVPDVSKTTIDKILREHLGYSKVCAIWVPKMLTEDHKRQRVYVAQKFLDCHKTDGEEFLDSIVTGDVTWVHYTTLETKEQSKQWNHISSPKPLKFKQTLSA
ncbi:hypothetical protein LAZ67_16002829 [Cordylochernes scorpioides]|uniref:Mos1 transposase HTH domain-containing protein n=1 Tax=Cordylochernes scorpioides TaxID=51811 RepID=A0ABY6LEE5_9ARAC|nr:hypothetical protein LAZ67_16002829 [Cordylochernes scorpioides]